MTLKTRISKLEQKLCHQAKTPVRELLVKTCDEIHQMMLEKNLAVLSPEDQEVYLRQEDEQKEWERCYQKKNRRGEFNAGTFSEIRHMIETKSKVFESYSIWRKSKGCMY